MFVLHSFTFVGVSSDIRTCICFYFTCLLNFIYRQDRKLTILNSKFSSSGKMCVIHIITIATADGVISANDDIYLQLALGTCPLIGQKVRIHFNVLPTLFRTNP